MLRSRKFLVVWLVIIAVLVPLLSWAWVIGGFEIPAKKVKLKPKPPPVIRNLTNTSVPMSSSSSGGQTFRDSTTGMEFV